MFRRFYLKDFSFAFLTLFGLCVIIFDIHKDETQFPL